MGAFGSLAARRQGGGVILQVGVRVAGVETQNRPGLLEAEPCDPAVAVFDQTRRKLESILHKPVAVGNEEELLGLKGLGHRQSDVIAAQVIRLAGGIPSDAGKNRDHPLVEDLLERLLEDLLDPAGILEIDTIND